MSSRSGQALRGGRLVLGAVMAVAVAGCGGVAPTGSATRPASTWTAPAPAVSSSTRPFPAGASAPDHTIATATTTVVSVFRAPSDTVAWLRLTSPSDAGAPRVFLVTEVRGGWLHVLLPLRPNGSTGWVRATEVATATTDFWIDIYRSAHRIVVRQGDRTFLDEPIAVGTADTPTPGGLYYLTQLLRPPDPGGVYGPYAYGLSGYSDELHTFAGGPGQLGLHGTNQPDLLGHDVSHGCIRMSNAGITRLAAVLPLGTPVAIHP